VDELIELLRDRARDHGGDKLLEEAAAALEAAREDACVSLVADIRFACGDNGKRMQAELVEFIRELAEDAGRLDWMDANEFTAYRSIDPIDGLSDHAVVVHESQRPRRGNVADTIRQAIDQARGKGVPDGGR
jgi:hypothetical protein